MNDTTKLKELYKQLGVRSQNGAMKAVASIADDKAELNDLRNAVTKFQPDSLPKLVIHHMATRQRALAEMHEHLAHAIYGVNGRELAWHELQDLQKIILKLQERSNRMDEMQRQLVDLYDAIVGSGHSIRTERLGIRKHGGQVTLDDVRKVVDDLRRELTLKTYKTAVAEGDWQPLVPIIDDVLEKFGTKTEQAEGLGKSRDELIRAVDAAAEFIGTMRRYSNL